MDTQLRALRDSIAIQRELPPASTRRALREAAGVTQDAVASACGVTRQAVSTWEAGRATPHGEKLVRYLRVLRLLKGADV